MLGSLARRDCTRTKVSQLCGKALHLVLQTTIHRSLFFHLGLFLLLPFPVSFTFSLSRACHGGLAAVAGFSGNFSQIPTTRKSF